MRIWHLFPLLTFLAMAAKIFGIASLTWGDVFAPLWIPIVVLLIATVVALIGIALRGLLDSLF